jgi:hypothetical protein
MRDLGSPKRIVTGAGYRGHKAPAGEALQGLRRGCERGLSATIKRAFRRRSAIESAIGHLKSKRRMGHRHLGHSASKTISAVLAALDYNFRLSLSGWRFYTPLSKRYPHPLEASHRHINSSDQPFSRATGPRRLWG